MPSPHDTSTLAVHVVTSQAGVAQLRADWEEHRMPVPLILLESPYRQIAPPIAAFIAAHRERHGPSVVTVYLPQYMVGHWWERVLHNQRARRLAGRLMLIHGVSVTLVPWLLDSSSLVERRQGRPLPGDTRGGFVDGAFGLVAHAAEPETPEAQPPVRTR